MVSDFLKYSSVVNGKEYYLVFDLSVCICPNQFKVLLKKDNQSFTVKNYLLARQINTINLSINHVKRIEGEREKYYLV